jgi:pimeloyl-ACP methyl ester carboxylesterase
VSKTLSRKNKTGSGILTVLIVILAIAGILEWVIYQEVSKYTSPPARDTAMDPTSLLLNVNEIQFRSKDGATLHGWLIPGKAGFPVLIIAHNYKSDRSETLGNLEGLITDLNKQGYFIFLFDFRGHGASSGRSALGYKEHDDLQAALMEVLKYKQIDRRVAVLGIGMGAIAATEACKGIDEVRFVILDSIYQDVTARCTDGVLQDFPFARFTQPVLIRAVDWNVKYILNIPSTRLDLVSRMPLLYPRPVLFVEGTPASDTARELYKATKEPKEMIQLGETASGELMGDSKERYKTELEKKILQYFPPENHEQTMELPK